MRQLLIAAVFSVLAPASWADEAQLPKSPFLPIDPPAKWLSAPFKGHISVGFHSPERTKELCTEATGKREEMGCAYGNDWYCVVIVADNLGGAVRDLAVRHEVAHCRGWPGDHPTD